jgi:hypothetical protein
LQAKLLFLAFTFGLSLQENTLCLFWQQGLPKAGQCVEFSPVSLENLLYDWPFPPGPLDCLTWHHAIDQSPVQPILKAAGQQWPQQGSHSQGVVTCNLTVALVTGSGSVGLQTRSDKLSLVQDALQTNLKQKPQRLVHILAVFACICVYHSIATDFWDH